MYSPADFPSRLRAAPAKKRRLSAANGISSRDAISGLPTLSDSSCASSSAFASSTSASLWRSSERSFGVASSHAGSAVFAAVTARSTSSALQRGTSAIVSPVAGLITSIVSPDAASTHSPPTKFLYAVFVALICASWSDRGHLGGFHCFSHIPGCASQDAGVAHQALRERDRDHRQQDHGECNRIHDGQLLPEPDVAEDQQRQRRLCTCREEGDDDLVEREREREQSACDERRREYGPDDEPECLPAVGAKIHRRLDQ